MRQPTREEILNYIKVCENTGASKTAIAKAAKFFHTTKKSIISIIG